MQLKSKDTLGSNGLVPAEKSILNVFVDGKVNKATLLPLKK